MKEKTKNEVISKDLMTIPNAISFCRILLITPFVAFFIEKMYVAAAITVGISGLSDLFDGMIARKFNQESELGKVLDPLADKLTLIAVGVCICFLEPYVIPLMILMVTKDVLMIIGGTIIINNGVIPPKASWYGKASTFMFYVSVGMVVLMAILNYKNEILCFTVLGITAGMMIFSLVNYAIIFFKIQKQLKSKADDKVPVQASITGQK